MLALARTMAGRIVAAQPEVSRVLLFGSWARGDCGARSDLDLLVVLKSSSVPVRERIGEILRECGAYPTDVFPLTEAELEGRLRAGDPFWTRAVREAIDCTPARIAASG
jgi:predicted nucleotidyltransferase